jgi:hypothetical protein
MGYGTVLPSTQGGYVVAAVGQLCGVLVNVFVFAAVMAKFQAPQADLVWSGQAVITRRDGVPTLLARVGNLRCHTLYNPTIRLTLLRRNVTEEGEGYMQKLECDVVQPATISGVHTIAHSIDEASPLHSVVAKHSKQQEQEPGDGSDSERCAPSASLGETLHWRGPG